MKPPRNMFKRMVHDGDNDDADVLCLFECALNKREMRVMM